MNGCFVLYPFELGETLTKRINVGVSTDNSFGCELAEDVVCMEDIPPYDVSLRDGWAISTTEGNHTLVGELVKNGEQPALLQKNGSRWINTGGFLPLAADAVVSDSDPQAPDFAADVYPYENVLPRGTEWTKGSLILKKGTVLGAGAQALLFEAGIENIRVWKRPSAAILATGHEIAEAGALSSAGRHSSNAVYLMNLLSGLGLTDTAIFYAKDEADSIADRLEVLAQSFDFIITVGGTGQGKSDMLRLALKRAGAKQSEDQTKLSSSLPFVCANLKGAVLFGLPGNPLGFVNIVQRVVLPVIWQSFRTDPFFVRRQKVFMGFDYEGKAGDICVQLAPFEGRVIALPVQKGSGRSSAFRDAAAAIPNPQGRRIEAGEAVEAQLFFNGLLS